jgi:hypothetical protein
MSDKLLSDADLGLDKPKLLSDEDLGIGARGPSSYGERQGREDEAKVKAAEGVAPEALKAGTYSALNAALFGAPSHLVAAGTYLAGKRPYGEVYKEQKEYEEALARRNPIASGVGTVGGLGAGMLVPLGPVARAGQLAKAAVAPRAGELAGRAAESATMGGILSGAGSYIESGGPFATDQNAVSKAVRDAAIGAGAGAVLGPAVSGIASRLAKKPPVVDDAGNLTPQASRAVEEAFGSRLSPDDIQRLRPQLEEVMGQKGISTAAAKEALLKSEQVTPSRSMVLGTRPSEAAAPAAEEAAIAGRETLTKTAETLAGAQKPSLSMAEALHRAEREANKAANAQYEKTFSSAGEFSNDFLTGLAPKIQQGLMKANMPSSISDYSNLANFVYAPQALKLIESVSAGNLPLKQPANMRNLDMVFQSLNELSRKADGKDRMAISAMKRSFMDALDDGVQTAMFSGNGKQVLSDLRESRKLWSEYKNSFYGKDTANSVFKKALQEFKDETGNILPIGQLDAASAQTANAILGANLLKPNTGAKVYEKFEKTFGKGSEELEAVRAYLRSEPFKIQNNLSELPKSIDAFLRPENKLLANKIFSPAELSQMRRLSEATKIINASRRTEPEKQSLIMRALQRVPSAIIGTAAGYLHGWPGALVGTALSEGVGAAARGLGRSMQVGAERAGAPIVRPDVIVPSPVRNIPALYPESKESDYEVPGTRPGRAAGGKVMSAEAHADRLVGMAERAKNMLGKETKPLLNTPDEHVAKALEIANRHI